MANDTYSDKAIKELTAMEKQRDDAIRMANDLSRAIFEHFGEPADRRSSPWNEALSLIKSRGQWISVNDRLPEYTFQAGGLEIAYVIVSAGGLVCQAEYSGGKFRYLGMGGEYPQECVTHWMPLPSPPMQPLEDRGGVV